MAADYASDAAAAADRAASYAAQLGTSFTPADVLIGLGAGAYYDVAVPNKVWSQIDGTSVVGLTGTLVGNVTDLGPYATPLVAKGNDATRPSFARYTDGQCAVEFTGTQFLSQLGAANLPQPCTIMGLIRANLIPVGSSGVVFGGMSPSDTDARFSFLQGCRRGANQERCELLKIRCELFRERR